MLGIGRRCNSAGGDGVAAGEASRGPAGAGLRAAIVGAWRWPNRVGRKRLMPRLTASGPLPVRNLVTLLGGIVAIVTALSGPDRLRHHRLPQGGAVPQVQGRAYRLTGGAIHLRARGALEVRHRSARGHQRDRHPDRRAHSPAPDRQAGRGHDAEGQAAAVADVCPPSADLRFRRAGRHGRGIGQPASVAGGGERCRGRRLGAGHRGLPCVCHPAARRHRSNAGRGQGCQRQAGAAEPPPRHGAREHGPGAGHVRCRGAHRHRQRPLRATVRARSRADQTGHVAAPRSSSCAWPRAFTRARTSTTSIRRCASGAWPPTSRPRSPTSCPAGA